MMGTVAGPEDVAAVLRKLIEDYESGDLTAVSLRVYKADGTWEDLSFGDDAEDRATTLAALHKMLAQAH